jgi:hypothetical protein
MKMRIIISSLLSAAIALGVVSCKDEEREGYLGDTDFVRFTRATGAVDEIAESFPVLVSYTKKDANATTTVTFEVEDITAVAGVDYEILNATNTLSFGAGEYIDTIWVKPLQNDIACGPDRQLKIKITEATNGAYVGFPQTGASAEFTLSIREVVALDIEAFANAEYIVEEFSPSGVPYAGNPISVSVFLDPERPNTIGIFNLGDWGGSQPAFFTFDPSLTNQVITILETPNGIPFGAYGIPSLIPYTVWTGSGTYNVCTGAMSVTYSVKNPLTNEVDATAINVFTRQ